MTVFEWFKLILIGIVEGITEWLPVSSTAHMLLLDEILPLNQSAEFKDVFFIVIQLGAIMAVVVKFWKKLSPFGYGEQPGMAQKKCYIKKEIFMMWFKIAFACIPGFITAMLFDDYIEAHLQTPYIIGATLAIYGIILVIIEQVNKKKTARITSVDDLSFKDAFIIGLFQCLSIIPGTSRSGSTIATGLMTGVSKNEVAQFSFLMVIIPILGEAFLDLIGGGFSFSQCGIAPMSLFVGFLAAYLSGVFACKFFCRLNP